MNSKIIFNRASHTMKNQYYICDNIGKILFYCDDVIECHDFSGMGYCYLFALLGISDQNVSHLLDDQPVTLRSSCFSDRFSIEFLIKRLIKISDDVLYLYVEDIRQGMYEFGALSLLKIHGNDDGRIWLDMKGDTKRIYIAASYLVNGEKYILDDKPMIIEGKYIHDYYSFFCEVGYSFFGGFGYVGDSIYSLDDYFSKLRKIDVVWKDSSISLKAIDNTIPAGYRGRSSYDLLSILEGSCNLMLD
ncbi:hypothetical protein GYD59_004561 [Salmonella enterica]|uniref:hypothetical protein n=1 Tax=Salmonella enterica TaxID=28901 RepID=UPI001010D19D|nr:hypothetical protein [Salmonella enterica]EDP9826664.1 hypothetical protein [Salmonella enterica subsp. enterica]EDS4738615.1 hypothetical protein [Salmonella enterica subsp. enterica serovar Oranienburg]EDF8720462.1 hypothetical protein [Salmonella enterica]EEH2569733.1 hypothetical protein [Salmonella enterica]RXO32010.1 hypothetical protein D0525_24255 [Salmonella enterica]